MGIIAHGGHAAPVHRSGDGAVKIAASVGQNGDKKPDRTGGVTHGNMSKTLAMVAGARGFVFHLQTSGHAGIKGKSRSSYKGFLTVSVTADGSSQQPKIVCITSAFGKARCPEMRGVVKAAVRSRVAVRIGFWTGAGPQCRRSEKLA